MIERAVVHVGGPPGAGKTTLIESLLRSYDGLVLVARCVRDDSLRSSRESAPKRHPEMRRYREAGASGAALFRFPFADILGWRGTRTPITAVAANLADPANRGSRKALARIRRSIWRVAEL
jgi:uridine kinase